MKTVFSHVRWVKVDVPYTLESLKRERKNRYNIEWHRKRRNAQKAYERWAVYRILPD